MRRVVAIRPEPGLAATLRAGRKAGLEIEGFPLFEVRAVSWIAPSPDDVDGLLIGSANALRNAGPQIAAFLHKPVFAVGETTAAAARQAGFQVELAGAGGLQQVVDALAGRSLHLLRLCAQQRVPLALPEGISVIERVVYEAVPLPMGPALVDRLRDQAVVLLHSGEAARHFAAECDRLGIDRGRICLAALGQRIAEAAGPGWRDCRWARATSEVALLALARDMCHLLAKGRLNQGDGGSIG